MSIWCSWEHIGTDPNDWHEVTDGIQELDLGGDTETPKGRLLPKIAERGNVVSYAEGFSNHYPDLTGTHERPAVIALASIAPWCTPGHDQSGENYSCSGCGEYHDHPDVGSWLRLEVAAVQTLNFWAKDDDRNPAVEERCATVSLDVEAATALRDDLNAWLEMNHLTPIVED